MRLNLPNGLSSLGVLHVPKHFESKFIYCTACDIIDKLDTAFGWAEPTTQGTIATLLTKMTKAVPQADSVVHLMAAAIGSWFCDD